MDTQAIMIIVGCTLAVAFIAYLIYLIYRQFTILLLILLFILGGVICRYAIAEGDLHPAICILLVGVWIGSVSIPLFLVSNIKDLEVHVGRLRKRFKTDLDVPMNNREVKRLKDVFKDRPKDELQHLLSEANTEQYTPEAFEAIRQILSEQGH